MPRDSNGNTSPLPGTIVATGDTVLPSQHNPMVNDVYAMMTQSLSRDGQGGMRAALDMSNYRVINVGPATQPTDAVSLGQFQSGTPIGAITGFAGATAPNTWMFCYGQAVSRAAYPLLFTELGTAWGAGDGTTTFNLPDFRGRGIVGKDNMGGTPAGRVTTAGSGINGLVLGAVGGVQSVILTILQLAGHTHTGTTGSAGAHTHPISTVGSGSGSGMDISYSNDGGTPRTFNTNSAGAHTHPFTTASTGGGEAHNNMQPSGIANIIIKVSY